MLTGTDSGTVCRQRGQLFPGWLAQSSETPGGWVSGPHSQTSQPEDRKYSHERVIISDGIRLLWWQRRCSAHDTSQEVNIIRVLQGSHFPAGPLVRADWDGCREFERHRRPTSVQWHPFRRPKQPRFSKPPPKRHTTVQRRFEELGPSLQASAGLAAHGIPALPAELSQPDSPAGALHGQHRRPQRPRVAQTTLAKNRLRKAPPRPKAPGEGKGPDCTDRGNYWPFEV